MPEIPVSSKRDFADLPPNQMRSKVRSNACNPYSFDYSRQIIIFLMLSVDFFGSLFALSGWNEGYLVLV